MAPKFDTPIPRDTERRWKILYISPELLLHLRLFGGQRNGDTVTLSSMDLPEDVKVHRLFWSDDHQAFGWIISHPSFEPVGDACIIPTALVLCRVEILRVENPTAKAVRDSMKEQLDVARSEDRRKVFPVEGVPVEVPRRGREFI